MGPAAIDEIAANAASAVGALVGADLTVLEPRELLALAQTLEVVHRQLNASLDTLTAEIDRAGAHTHDGHFTVRSFWKAACRNSGTEATGRTRTARALQLLPLVAKSYRAGDIPLAHMRLLGRVAHNPRITDAFIDSDALFCDWALQFDVDDFTRLLKHWETLADHDGADNRDNAHHRLRAFSMTQDLDGAWTLQGRLDRLTGAVVSEVFEHFAHAEYLTDWADATTEPQHRPGTGWRHDLHHPQRRPHLPQRRHRSTTRRPGPPGRRRQPPPRHRPGPHPTLLHRRIPPSR